MPIAIGDRLPAVTFKHLTENGMAEVTTSEIFDGKKVVLFAVPGAFTPTCSAKHLPGFVEHEAAIKAKGVDNIVCIAVNDPFVMKAWGAQADAGKGVMLLPDGNCEFTKAIDLVMDGSVAGLGNRSKRYAMIVDDGVVASLEVEEPGNFEVSSAEAVLKRL